MKIALYDKEHGIKEWVTLLSPAADGFIHTSKGSFRLDMDAIIANFLYGGNDMLIDYEHQALLLDKAPQPVPASGWIKELKLENNDLVARVTWTPKAEAYIIAEEYRYLSPVIVTNSDGTVVSICNVALTNQPATYYSVPLSKVNLNAKPIMEDDKMIKILQMLGLASTATELDAAAAIEGLQQKVVKAEKALSLSNPTAEQIEGKIIALTSNTDTLKSTQDELTKLRAMIAKKEADELVSVALSEGKLAPAQKDWALSYAATNADGFKVWLSTAIPITVMQKPPEVKQDKVSDVHADIFKKCGVSVEDVKKYNS